MKQTISDIYSILAKGSAHELNWKIYARRINVLNGALTGTWIDITDRIDIESFTGISTQIEYNLGQFKANELELVGKGIDWFDNNLFSDDPSNEYSELKIEFSLIGASDTIYMFVGMIDKDNVIKNESNDTVKFSIYTNDYLSNDMPAEYVTMQQTHNDVDGNLTTGLILFNIPGIFVIDANISGHVLSEGIHTIIYEYNDGNRRIKLDNAEFPTYIPVDDFYYVSNEFNEQIKIYVVVNDLPTDYEPHQQKIVIVNKGDTLPRTWFNRVPLKYVLKKFYSTMGIDNLTLFLDSLEFPSYDNSKRLSYLDTPPFPDGAVNGDKRAIVGDGANLYIAVENRVYKRVIETLTYSLVFTTTYEIVRMWYNARNNHLWAFDQGGYLWLHNLNNGNSYSIALNTVYDQVRYTSMELIDYNYSGSNYRYRFVYTDENSGTDKGLFVEVEFTGSALYKTTIATGSGIGYSIRSRFAYVKNNNRFRFFVENNFGQLYYQDFYINSSGSWVNNGALAYQIPDNYNLAAYNNNEDRIYYWLPSSYELKSHTNDSGTATLIQGYSSGDTIGCLYYNSSDNKVYTTIHHYDYLTEQIVDELYSLSNNTMTFEHDGIYCIYNQMYYTNSRLYLINHIDKYQGLYQWYPTVFPSLTDFDLSGKYIYPELCRILNTYLFAGVINANKHALIYRRCDNSGIPLTSGNYLTITKDMIVDIEVDEGYLQNYDIVIMRNSTTEVRYDGTNFYEGEPKPQILPYQTSIEINNDNLPNEFLKDIAYIAYQYFKNKHKLVKLTLDIEPLFQYEVFDGADLDTIGCNIEIVDSGVIQNINYNVDGSIVLEVLI